MLSAWYIFRSTFSYFILSTTPGGRNPNPCTGLRKLSHLLLLKELPELDLHPKKNTWAFLNPSQIERGPVFGRPFSAAVKLKNRTPSKPYQWFTVQFIRKVLVWLHRSYHPVVMPTPLPVLNSLTKMILQLKQQQWFSVFL